MTTISLTCGHPAIVTHERGERLVGCAVPSCGTADVIAAVPVSHVDYINRSSAVTS